MSMRHVAAAVILMVAGVACTPDSNGAKVADAYGPSPAPVTPAAACLAPTVALQMAQDFVGSCILADEQEATLASELQGLDPQQLESALAARLQIMLGTTATLDPLAHGLAALASSPDDAHCAELAKTLDAGFDTLVQFGTNESEDIAAIALLKSKPSCEPVVLKIEATHGG